VTNKKGFVKLVPGLLVGLGELGLHDGEESLDADADADAGNVAVFQIEHTDLKSIRNLH